MMIRGGRQEARQGADKSGMISAVCEILQYSNQYDAHYS